MNCVSCLVFNRPRREDWSHCRQFFSILSCLMWLSSAPLHSLMLSIHFFLGLPLVLVPGTVPCIISFSRQSPCFLIRCPKYDIFLLLISSSRLLSTPAVSSTHSFVFFSVHDTLSIFLMHLISNAFILSSSFFLIVQLSKPYIITDHIRVLMSFNFVLTLML